MKSGKLEVAVGSSRSGKSQYVKKQIKPFKSVLVWDAKAEYGGGGVVAVTSLAAFADYLKSNLGVVGRVAFQPHNLGDFSGFCRLAQVWIKGQYKAGRQCAIVFEETADVTSPAKAPAEYGVILRRFLAYGVNIFAVTQRPAESDKTAIGNASKLHICRMARASDRKAIANDSGLSIDLINGLRADQDMGRFDFITCDTGRGQARRGLLSFTRAGVAKFSLVGDLIKI